MQMLIDNRSRVKARGFTIGKFFFFSFSDSDVVISIAHSFFIITVSAYSKKKASILTLLL
jgi:hypothetical protein